ncbi:hypothetical protein V8F20_003817 [Naviculisporaceae sp. PSN 640]
MSSSQPSQDQEKDERFRLASEVETARPDSEATIRHGLEIGHIALGPFLAAVAEAMVRVAVIAHGAGSVAVAVAVVATATVLTAV